MDLIPNVQAPEYLQRNSSAQSSQNDQETHVTNGDVIRDIILGFADGLTVPFALTAGLSSLGSSKLVIIGGLAELFSGSISMGLGAYLAAVTDRDHYFSEERRERREIEEKPEVEREECFEIMHRYGISSQVAHQVVADLCRDCEKWVQFMMDFELKMEKPNASRAWISSATIAAAYFIGGLIPMIPYLAVRNVNHALFISIAITVVVLLGFGYTKNWYTVHTKRSAFYGAFQTLLVGSVAAATSYGIVKAVDGSNL